MSACTENQPSFCRLQTDVGPILLAELGQTCKSGRRRHDIIPLSPRGSPDLMPTFPRAKANGGPIPSADVDPTCISVRHRHDIFPLAPRCNPDLMPTWPRGEADGGPILYTDVNLTYMSGRHRHDVVPLSPRRSPDLTPTTSRCHSSTSTQHRHDIFLPALYRYKFTGRTKNCVCKLKVNCLLRSCPSGLL